MQISGLEWKIQLHEFVRPKLPSVEKLPYLREIDKNRWYSNRGMLAEKY